MADTLEDQLFEIKRHLSHISLEASRDRVLARSVRDQKSNTYSAILKEKTSSTPISHMTITSSSCDEVITSTDQLTQHAQQSGCDQHDLNKFKWIIAGASTGLSLTPPSTANDVFARLSITRSLGKDYLISTTTDITSKWLAELGDLSDIHPRHLKFVSAEASPITSTQALALSYIYASGIHLTDHHPLSKILQTFISPYGSTELPLNVFVILFIMSLLILAVYHHNRAHQLTSTLHVLNSHIAQRAQKEQIDEGSLTDVFYALDDKTTKLWDQNHDLTLKLKANIEKIQQQQSTIAELSSYRDLTQEVTRNARLIAHKLKEQHEDEEDTKDLLELIHSLSVHPICQILKRWDEDLKQRGARKFLRSSLEVADDDSPNRSIFETQIYALLENAEKITFLTHSLLKQCHQKSKSCEHLETILNYWTHTTDHPFLTQTVAQMIDHAAWQLRGQNIAKLEINRPHWIEPSTLTGSFCLVLRCMLYEILSYLCSVSSPPSTESHPTKTHTFTIHYVPHHPQGIIITHQLDPQDICSDTAEQAYQTLKDRIDSYHHIYGLAIDTSPATQHSNDHLCCTLITWSHNSNTYLKNMNQQIGDSDSHPPFSSTSPRLRNEL